MKKSNLAVRIIALLILHCFLVTQIGWAAPISQLRGISSVEKKSTGKAISNVGLLPHRGRNRVNDWIEGALEELLSDENFVDNHGITPAEIETFKRLRQRGEETRGAIPIEKLSGGETKTITIGKGKELKVHIVSLFNRSNLGNSPDGKSVTAHIGLKDRVIWVAANRRAEDREMDITHEKYEWAIISKEAEKRGWDMDFMAKWRDWASDEAVKFFNKSHREAWFLTAREYRSESKRLRRARYFTMAEWFSVQSERCLKMARGEQYYTDGIAITSTQPTGKNGEPAAAGGADKATKAPRREPTDIQVAAAERAGELLAGRRAGEAVDSEGRRPDDPMYEGPTSVADKDGFLPDDPMYKGPIGRRSYSGRVVLDRQGRHPDDPNYEMPSDGSSKSDEGERDRKDFGADDRGSINEPPYLRRRPFEDKETVRAVEAALEPADAAGEGAKRGSMPTDVPPDRLLSDEINRDLALRRAVAQQERVVSGAELKVAEAEAVLENTLRARKAKTLETDPLAIHPGETGPQIDPMPQDQDLVDFYEDVETARGNLAVQQRELIALNAQLRDAERTAAADDTARPSLWATVPAQPTNWARLEVREWNPTAGPAEATKWSSETEPSDFSNQNVGRVQDVKLAHARASAENTAAGEEGQTYDIPVTISQSRQTTPLFKGWELLPETPEGRVEYWRRADVAGVRDITIPDLLRQREQTSDEGYRARIDEALDEVSLGMALKALGRVEKKEPEEQAAEVIILCGKEAARSYNLFDADGRDCIAAVPQGDETLKDAVLRVKGEEMNGTRFAMLSHAELIYDKSDFNESEVREAGATMQSGEEGLTFNVFELPDNWSTKPNILCNEVLRKHNINIIDQEARQAALASVQA